MPIYEAALLEASTTLARAETLVLTRELERAAQLLDQVEDSPAITHLPLALSLELLRARSCTGHGQDNPEKERVISCAGWTSTQSCARS